MQIPIKCSHTEQLTIEELKRKIHPLNPKKHPPEQVERFKKILAHQGIRRAIVISRRSGLIVAGHGLLETLEQMQCEKAPVDFQEFSTEADELAHMVADNKLAELGYVNETQVNQIVAAIEDAGLDAELAGLVKELAEDSPLTNAQYPITAKLHENYDCVVIFTTSETDFVFLQTLCGVQTESSYKKTGIGVGRCIPFKKFLKSIHENRDSINVAPRDHDHAPTAR